MVSRERQLNYAKVADADAGMGGKKKSSAVVVMLWLCAGGSFPASFPAVIPNDNKVPRHCTAMATAAVVAQKLTSGR